MKKIILPLTLVFFLACSFQNDKTVNNTTPKNNNTKINTDSIVVDLQVKFYIYDGPYGDKKNIKEPSVKFILTVTNNGEKPIPNVGVSNRSEYVNLLINDSVRNPVSLYNGAEIVGDHMIQKNGSDTYTWWFFEKEAYAQVFTVQWQYMDKFSQKMKVDIKKKTIEQNKSDRR